jgi:hypothetical protein
VVATSPISPELAAALNQAEAILQHDVDGAGVLLSKLARSFALDSISWLGAAPLDQSRVETRRAAGVGSTKELELEAAGVFEAYNDGARVGVSSRSIVRRRIALAILSHPVGGPQPKIRQPSARHQKRPRERTPAEIEGLRRGNAQRAEQAQKRREAKAAARV